MDNQDKVLFQKALLEAFARKYEHELSECAEDGTYSDDHARKMKRILQGGAPVGKGKSSLKTRIIVGILVAAALLLAGCTAYTYREKIRNFIEELFPCHIMITHDVDSEAADAEEIAAHYVLTYVPEGYAPVCRRTASIHTAYEWQNPEGEYITLEQCVMNGADFMLDAEKGNTVVKRLGGYMIYFRATNTFTYVWNDGTYSFQLVSSVELSDDMIIDIVEGLQQS